MSLTLRGLVEAPGLRLEVLTAPSRVDRPITWVHVSELEDPTPFLQGGELLLTTGLALGVEGMDEYVQRLASAGVVGLGFGTGLSHTCVPHELLAAAHEHGLPVVEVPRDVPFIAISRAVSKALAAEEYAAVTRTYAAQQALSRAALTPAGPAALVRQLSQQVGGWVLLLDAAGVPVHATPEGAAARAAGVAADVDRLRGHRAPASASFTLDGDRVLLQSLGAGARTRGFLAAGRPAGFTATDRHIVNAAILLLTLRLEQSTALDDAAAALRSGLFRLLLAGDLITVDRTAAGLWGPLPPEPVRVVTVTGTPELRSAAVDVAIDAAERGAHPEFHAEVDGALVLVVADSGPLLGTVLELPTRLRGLGAGVSEALPYARVADAHRQSRQAAEQGARAGSGVTRFADVAGDGLLRLIDPGTASAYADALLAPVLEHDRTGRGDLLASLRAWLEFHGQWDRSAARLQVHRHTLRNRIRKAEELLGRNLDSPGARAELWLALQARDAAGHGGGTAGDGRRTRCV
jgi:purine catabolism regulator